MTSDRKGRIERLGAADYLHGNTKTRARSNARVQQATYTSTPGVGAMLPKLHGAISSKWHSQGGRNRLITRQLLASVVSSRHCLDAAYRTAIHGGTAIPKVLANSVASSSVVARMASKRLSASRILWGGPRSKSSLGGGRSKSISLICVARENMTYRWNHHVSSCMPSFPEGSKRAQSMVTPVRMV